VSIKELPAEFVRLFDQANAMGLDHIDEIVDENPFGLYDLRKYYTMHLSYRLDERKKKGMAYFLEVISEK
ncbi:MAG TPA: hypothetical protein PKG90_16780, partial [Chitinophagaceae bacterium]|nr:hypothetical protein [Chitinophagaceae bacterium]